MDIIDFMHSIDATLGISQEFAQGFGIGIMFGVVIMYIVVYMMWDRVRK